MGKCRESCHVTKAVAQAKLSERKRQVRLGQLDMIEAHIPTLSQFAEDYIKYVRDVRKKRSWFRDTYSLRHLLDSFRDKKLSEITPKDVDDYKELRLGDVKPATVNREIECLRHLFNLAKRWRKFFGDNPVSESGLLEVDNQIEKILTPEEEGRLFLSSPPHLKSIIMTALNTGMRKGEIISLKWTDVDFENNLIIVSYLVSKSKKSRRIPINISLRKLLLDQKPIIGGSEYVFLSSKGKPYKRHDSLNRAFEAACRRSGINGLRFHDLRHTAATRMVESGGNIVAVSRILGHADLRTTMRYAHPDNSVKDAVEKLGPTCSNFRSNGKIVQSSDGVSA